MSISVKSIFESRQLILNGNKKESDKIVNIIENAKDKAQSADIFDPEIRTELINLALEQALHSDFRQTKLLKTLKDNDLLFNKENSWMNEFASKANESRAFSDFVTYAGRPTFIGSKKANKFLIEILENSDFSKAPKKTLTDIAIASLDRYSNSSVHNGGATQFHLNGVGGDESLIDALKSNAKKYDTDMGYAFKRALSKQGTSFAKRVAGIEKDIRKSERSLLSKVTSQLRIDFVANAFFDIPGQKKRLNRYLKLEKDLLSFSNNSQQHQTPRPRATQASASI